ISLALTFDRAAKAQKRLQIASERIAELKAMTEKGKPEFAEKLAEESEKEVDEAMKDVEEAEAKGKDMSAVRAQIQERAERHIAVLQRVMEKAPEQAKSALQRVMERAQVRAEQRTAEMQQKGQKAMEGAPVAGKPEGIGMKPETAGKPVGAGNVMNQEREMNQGASQQITNQEQTQEQTGQIGQSGTEQNAKAPETAGTGQGKGKN
ncbi:MAG: DUF5667 domain-containing protein, partial [Candidatus Woesearchaeota archaeon]